MFHACTVLRARVVSSTSAGGLMATGLSFCAQPASEIDLGVRLRDLLREA